MQERVDRAWAVINGGESSVSTLRTLHGWSGSETRRNQFADLGGALAAWWRWAAGGRVDEQVLGSALTIMREHDDPELQPSLDNLADWAERFNPSLDDFRQSERPQAVHREVGIEL